MKNLHRPIPKAKILEGLKKSTTFSSSLISNSISSPNVSTARKTIQSSLTTKSTSMIQARKSLGGRKLVDEKPKNTIRSMFQKQLEKSRIQECSQTSDDTFDEVVKAPNSTNQTTDVEPEKEESNFDKESNVGVESNGTCLVTGSLHKRLTRRNSMTVQTPTKSILKSNVNPEISSVLSSVKKRRLTMFTPSKVSIDENEATTTPEKLSQDGNNTINKTVEMDICNGPINDVVSNKCNSKVRQMLNNELLLNTPREKKITTFIQPNSSHRRTTYTPLGMDETKVQNSTITPISSATQRRKTMNVNAIASTPRSTTTRTMPDALIETKSCDAILTPTNKITGKFNS